MSLNASHLKHLNDLGASENCLQYGGGALLNNELLGGRDTTVRVRKKRRG